MIEFNNPLSMSPVFMIEWNLSGVETKSRLINLGIRDRSVERIGSARIPVRAGLIPRFSENHVEVVQSPSI